MNQQRQQNQQEQLDPQGAITNISMVAQATASQAKINGDAIVSASNELAKTIRAMAGKIDSLEKVLKEKSEELLKKEEQITKANNRLDQIEKKIPKKAGNIVDLKKGKK